jgi:hypothetical protein
VKLHRNGAVSSIKISQAGILPETVLRLKKKLGIKTGTQFTFAKAGGETTLNSPLGISEK